MDKIYNDIFSDSPCISQEELFAYVQGKLSAETLRRVESHLTGCELCSDAVEGIHFSVNLAQTDRVISEIKEGLMPDEKKLAPVIRFNPRRLMLAAGVIIILGIGGFFVNRFINPEPDTNKIFSQKFEPYKEKEKETQKEMLKSVNPKTDSGTKNIEFIPPTASEDIPVPMQEDLTVPMDSKDEATNEVVQPVPDDQSMLHFFRGNDPGWGTAGGVTNMNAAPPAPPAANFTSPSATYTYPSFDNSIVADSISVYSTVTLDAGKAEEKKSKQSLQKGIELYNDKKYPQAVSELSQVSASDEDYEKAQFYEAVSELGMNQAAPAAEKFRKIVKNNSSPYYESSKWYLALAYIKLGKKSDAAKLLKELNKPGGAYQSDAAETLKELGY